MDQNNRNGRSSNSRGRGTTNRNSGNSGSRSTLDGRGAGQATRSHSSSSRNSAKRRRKKRNEYTKIAIGVLLLIAAIVCIVFAVKGVTGGKKPSEDLTEPSSTEVELQNEVMVDGISITGLTQEQAKEAILAKHTWEMKVKYKEEEHQLKNLIDSKIDTLLDEIFTGETKDSYSLDLSGLEEEVKAEVAELAKKWDVPAKNGRIDSFNKETAQFVYAGEQKGIIINQDQLNKEINTAIKAKKFDAVITAAGDEVEPEITEAKAKELYKVLGRYATKTTSNSDRNTNIRLASEALDGLIIPSGGEFSFNKTTGNRTTQKGYRPAGAYQNGILVEEPGGGVCQVSSTLYNAVVFSGLKVEERHPHSYVPSYVTPGEDAMVSYDGYSGPDMRFVNNSPSAVAIRSSFENRNLTISIVGIPILEEGVVLSMSSKKTGETDPPTIPTYEENQTLQPGVEVVIKEGTKGSVWETNLVTKKNGEVISDKKMYTSRYRGKGQTIYRNTSGKVVPAETAPPPPTETASQPAETVPMETTESVNPDTNQSAPAGPGVKPTVPQSGTQPTTAPLHPGGGSGTVNSGPAASTTAAPEQSSEVLVVPGPPGSEQNPAGP